MLLYRKCPETFLFQRTLMFFPSSNITIKGTYQRHAQCYFIYNFATLLFKLMELVSETQLTPVGLSGNF